MLENATRICEATFGSMLLREGDGVPARRDAQRAAEILPRFDERRRLSSRPDIPLGRFINTKQVVHVADICWQRHPDDPDRQVFGGARTLLVVPMLKEDELIGAIGIYRQEVRPFTDKQIELVTNFAAQAVIAIENVRLLNELRARTDDLARSVGELQALGEVSQAVNSTLDLEQVLTTIVQRAVQLSRTDAGAIYVFDEARQEFKLRATYGMSDEMIVAITDRRIGTGDAHIGPAATERKPIQVPDIEKEPLTPVNEINLREGFRAVLIIPLLRPDHIVGALVVRRKTPGRIPAIYHRPVGDIRRPVGGGDPEREPVP